MVYESTIPCILASGTNPQSHMVDRKKALKIHAMPDIEMYGGDTLPWEVTLIRDDGTYFSVDTASACVFTLTVTPFNTSSGCGENATIVEPILTKTGVVESGTGDVAVVVFTFDEDDTIGLRGKFVYQIEVKHGEDLRVSQGCLYIKQNINRQKG